MTFMHTRIDYTPSKEEKAWVEEEVAEQEQRYATIYAQVDALKPQREIWYEQFFHRLQTRGFNADGDQRQKLAAADIPVKPAGREDKVIWKYGVDGE